ncbi:aminomethyl-transferring glycine dehydrogenase subunit GcvPB [Rickettsiales bacterium]|nr:aminomethyl-transferring glycine dehydrogenase subunit GcvPB [Rickettsiales bacterium]MDB2550785.1 aminomethyl-transferring glycine dehydrogenase subunit GcvPB [Rickettsiales bacterium]
MSEAVLNDMKEKTIENFIPKNVGLNLEEDLLFRQSREGSCGVDLPKIADFELKIGGKKREKIGLPELTEPDVIGHFVNLSSQNYSIDAGFYPLGSCTMKHNPRLNEKVARFPGFANIHPLQDQSTIQGALELMYELQNWLSIMTGLHSTCLAPAAGAQGELAGILTIRAALTAKGDARKIILIPDSAHGTNPATAATCGYDIKVIPSDKKTGEVNFEEFKKLVNEYGKDIAGIMLTNPNTCGKFESKVKEIADIIHEIGAYFYCDGANYNAIVGKIKPADIGVDVMHFNLHKTFSTPHGGGGPGCGPIAVSEELSDFVPSPIVIKENDQYKLSAPKHTVGKIKGFHGQFGMMVRALSYMMSHGSDGLKQVAEDAVLSANYVLAKLKNHYNVPFEGACMHECLINDKIQKEKNITTLDIAKALVEYGMHPMTVFFPLVTSGAMLIEPTETENKQVIDKFIDIMIYIAKEVENGDGDKFHSYPISTPRRRVNEVKAAKNTILTFDQLNSNS